MNARSFFLFLFIGAVILLSLAFAPPAAARPATQVSPLVLVLTADGPLTPSMSQYLKRGIQQAEQQGAEVLIFQLNTPGGSLDLMNAMVTTIRASSVPVVVYVAPRGAMAGSAGTMITLAGHASAMAPETTIGAASPVGGSGEDLGQTMQAKEKNILKATVRTLASDRPPEAVTLAEQTIDTAQAVSAQEALQIGLVDFIAPTVNDLLNQLNNFTVKVNDQPVTLQTANATVEEVPLSFIERILAALTNPNIVILLLNLGVIAILMELSSPGGWVAGFVGVICLALAGYGLGILTVNWFGLVFLVLAFALFILDIKAPTHGALTLAGVGSLIVSALVFFNTPSLPSFDRVSVPLVVFSSSIVGGLFFVILMIALRAQVVPVQTGREALIGREGTVSIDLKPRGQVRVGGELWSAVLASGEEEVLTKGARIEIVQVQGNSLVVRKAV